MKNRGSQYLRGKESMLKVMEAERRACKQIGEYVDDKSGVKVRVYEPCGDGLKFRSIPTGYSE